MYLLWRECHRHPRRLCNLSHMGNFNRNLDLVCENTIYTKLTVRNYSSLTFWSVFPSPDDYIYLLMLSGTFLHGTDTCVEQEEAFLNCYDQFNTMEKSDSFWESICR